MNLWSVTYEKNRRPHSRTLFYRGVGVTFYSGAFSEAALYTSLASVLRGSQLAADILRELFVDCKCGSEAGIRSLGPTVIYVVGGYIRTHSGGCGSARRRKRTSLAERKNCGLVASWEYARGFVPAFSTWPVGLRPIGRYNPNDETWSPIADMSRARLGLGVASLNRLLYAVGGFDGVERLQCVECYDPDTNSWRSVAPMSTVRSGAGMVALDGLLYAVGGYDGRNQLASVERYDSETNHWSPVAGMHTARSALSVVAVDGRIYAIGGYDGQEFSTAVESYDPELDEWTVERSMPEGRSGHGAAVWWGSCCYAELASPTPP
ncbi:putative Kelch-like ECH-associated protein 1 [Hypsibius exemplaris]|uniref:Kelch-like ECH-associated protein 1 n=1 Tax=Hypsibius exemplaris TaxID=2072580 RepID=A0A1W0X1L2_HYPEX|nr:putative Kelch-like ECH-associated protein 1 [Hypsibius exemplaris]